MITKKQFYLTHAPIDFVFIQEPDNFVVTEIPLYEFSGKGEHLVLKVRKKNLSTNEMLKVFSEQLGVKLRDIGYAGLKDKSAMTIQHISIPSTFEEKLALFRHEKIKILDANRHDNKLKIGHLKANRFFVRLKKVTPINAKKLKEAIALIKKDGFPNYFGYQRFGVEQNNFEIGKSIKEMKKPKRMDKFFINAYQSALFNSWLAKRIELGKMLELLSQKECESLLSIDTHRYLELKNQKHAFKILRGDVLNHYPFGKLFYAENLALEGERFLNREISPTGLLCGTKVKFAQEDAFLIEKEFIDQDVRLDGDRRYAWIFAEDLECRYVQEDAWFELNFTLPKGCYATTLLESAANRELT